MAHPKPLATASANPHAAGPPQRKKRRLALGPCRPRHHRANRARHPGQRRGPAADPPPATKNQTEQAQVRWATLALNTTTWGVVSTGELSGLPLAWANHFTPDDPISERAGISGDLRLQGRWDIDTRSAQPKLHATLERADGDMRIAANIEEAAPVTIIRSQGTDEASIRLRQPNRGQSIRLQALQATLDLEGSTLRSQVLCGLRTRGHEFWPPCKAPCSTIPAKACAGQTTPLVRHRRSCCCPTLVSRASFAPPGWRVEGGFSGAVAISGTRSAPEWEGSIEAQDLALSSLLEGVNLKNGQLKARFAGNRLDIEQLTLEGSRSGQARILGQSGNRTAPRKAAGT